MAVSQIRLVLPQSGRGLGASSCSLSRGDHSRDRDHGSDGDHRSAVQRPPKEAHVSHVRFLDTLVPIRTLA